VTETIPLNQRIQAPDAPIPASGNGITWRPASIDDIDAIMVCERAMNAVDHPHYVTNREEVEEDFTESWVDLPADSLLALDDAGNVIAWGLVTVSQGQETAVRVILHGGVRPDRRGQGLGRAVLGWQEARSLQLLAASDKALPGVLVAWSDERAQATIRLARRFGFDIARYYLELRRDLLEPIAAARPLEGYEIVAFDASRSEDVRLARNDAFRDHWGSQPVVEEAWASFLGRSIFRPDLSFLAVSPDGEVAGFVLSEVDEEDFEPQGFSSAYIDLVGARRDHRGKGIAAALLTRALEAIRDAGLQKAVLDVDSESLTGATRLYENVGFTPSNRSVDLRKSF
jgi:mycothiol synthase